MALKVSSFSEIMLDMKRARRRIRESANFLCKLETAEVDFVKLDGELASILNEIGEIRDIKKRMLERQKGESIEKI